MSLFYKIKYRFWLSIGASFLLLFPISIVSLPYVHGFVILAGSFLGVYFNFVYAKPEALISTDEKWFYFSVIFMVFVAIFVVLITGFDEGSFKKIGKFLYLLLTIPVYLFFRKINIQYTQFWYGLVFGALLSAGVALYDVWPNMPGIYNRAGGILNPIIFGDLALLLGAMSLVGVGWFGVRTRWQMAFSVIAFTFGLMASALSQSRGGWVVIPFIFIILLWYSSDYISRWKRVAGSVGLIILTLAAYQAPQTGVKKQVATSIANLAAYIESDSTHWSRDTSIGVRFESWKVSWRIFLDNPLIGVGWGNYQENARVFIEAGLYHKSAGYYNHPHNQYFSSMVSGGSLGLLATIALFVIPAVIFIRVIQSPGRSDDAHRMALAGLIMVVGFAVCNLTESFLERSRPVAFFLFYLAVCMAGIREEASNNLVKNGNTT